MTLFGKILNYSRAKTPVLFLLSITASLSTTLAQEKGNEQGVQRSNLELPQIQVVPIKDTQTGRQYELYVKLPGEYSENEDKKYPVIYYTDAMWHVELLSGSAEYIMEEALLVGISWQKDFNKDLLEEVGAHVSRYRDYTVSPSSNPENQAKYQLGQASHHLDFIHNNVIRFVEDNYLTDPKNRTYFGYSAGGLFGAYILSSRPETFKNYLIGSPSLRGDISYLAELIADKDLNVNVFISNGTEELELSEHVKEFVTILKNKNDRTLSLTYEEITGDHQTAFPRISVRSIEWLAELNKPNFPLLEGPYMGQEPPGMIAEPFAPGIISTEGWELEGVFAPDMKEFYFTLDRGTDTAENPTNFKPTVIGFREENNIWTK